MDQAIILGFLLLVTLYLLKRTRDPKLNVPLVHYKFPLIGHTYSYMTNSEKFLAQCRKEYGDIFCLYIWSQMRIFVGKEHVHEVFTKDDVFDFNKASDDAFPADELFKTMTDPVKKVKQYVLQKLKNYTERMQVNLYFATQKYIGDCDEPKVFGNLNKLLTRIVATPIASILLGEEESQYEEIVTTFSELTTDLGIYFIAPPLLNFIYPRLHCYFIRFLIKFRIYNPVLKHQELLTKHIKKQVTKRLQEKEKYGDSWKRPNDFLQDLMDEETFDSNNVDYTHIVDQICGVIFAAVHTTSRATANALIDLASRPEYMQELYEEQIEVHKEANEDGILPIDALEKMKKLDSFVRESLRLADNISGLLHFVKKDYTFSNGLTVPEGYLVEVYFDDAYRDESLQGPNPTSFEPFRHVDKNVQATRVGKTYLVFGGGKHACPGRHFAINEVKYFMHNAILKYNFRTESGKIEKKVIIGASTTPSNAGVIFEKRIK